MGIWYEKFDEYCKKIKKTTEEIKNGKYNSNFPGPFPSKYIRESSEEKMFYYSGPEKMKHILYKLQFFAHFNTDSIKNRKKKKIICNIFGQKIVFYLSESEVRSKFAETKTTWKRGNQIIFEYDDHGIKKMTQYRHIMPKLEAYPSVALGKAMLRALDTSTSEQTSQGLDTDIIIPASLFILLTHIPEAAIPFQTTIDEFGRAIYYNSKESTGPDNKIVNIKKMTGRIPMADKIVRSKLREVAQDKVSFTEAFNIENFVLRGKHGTSKGRTWVLKDEAGDTTGDLSDSEDETITSTGDSSSSDSEDENSLLTGDSSGTDSENEKSTPAGLPTESKYQENQNLEFLPES